MKTGLLASQPERKLTGQAAAQARAKAAREALLKQIAVILGRDKILFAIARDDGLEVARSVCEIYDLNWPAFAEQYEARTREVQQTTVRESPSASYDYDSEHSPEFMAVLLRGGSAAEMNAAREAAQRRIDTEKAGRKNTGPGGPDREPTQAPVQRSAAHRDVKFNAEEDSK